MMGLPAKRAMLVSTVWIGKYSTGLVLVILRRLVKEEIRGQLFVLVASEIRLDDHISLETETAKLVQSVTITLQVMGTLTLSIASRSSSVTNTS